jgi:CheY-like chemotaxis protein
MSAAPDVFAVVSDIAMPGSIDGFELVREVQRRWPEIGVVLVSGQMEPPKSHCPGGVLFLSKPFKASTLLRLLREIAERRVPS